MKQFHKATVLSPSFYKNNNVQAVAQALLGKILVTDLDGASTAGRIVESEAYEGVTDRASHAWSGRRTARTEIMYAAGGIAYVYLCYGIHDMFNVVTGTRDIPHAILIRAVEPLLGLDIMEQRTGKTMPDPSIGRGPGNVCKALGIVVKHTGTDLRKGAIRILDDGFMPEPDQIGLSPRIGVDYAGEHAEWHYRFYLRSHPNVSGKPKK